MLFIFGMIVLLFYTAQFVVDLESQKVNVWCPPSITRLGVKRPLSGFQTLTEEVRMSIFHTWDVCGEQGWNVNFSPNDKDPLLSELQKSLFLPES